MTTTAVTSTVTSADATTIACLCGMSSGAALALDAVAAGLDVPKLAVYEAPFLVEGDRAVGSDYIQRLDARLAASDRTVPSNCS